MSTNHTTSADLGTYDTRSQLDHDTDLEVESLLSTMDACGVSREVALASLRRVLKGRS